MRKDPCCCRRTILKQVLLNKEQVSEQLLLSRFFSWNRGMFSRRLLASANDRETRRDGHLKRGDLRREIHWRPSKGDISLERSATASQLHRRRAQNNQRIESAFDFYVADVLRLRVVDYDKALHQYTREV